MMSGMSGRFAAARGRRRREPATVPGPTGPGARLLVAGDTHGNLGWIETLAGLAGRHGCAGVLQLGDFGFWPDARVLAERGRAVLDERWLGAVADAFARHRVWLRVIDGNHDFHPGALAAHPPDGRGISVVRDGLVDWATRGSRWEWCGVRFGALGGAFSIDRSFRLLGQSWWDTETITAEDRRRLGSEPLDVLLTHDAPEGVRQSGVDVEGAKIDPRSRENRRLVEEARRATGPRLLLHGHYHLRYRGLLGDPPARTRIEGLAADIQGDGTAWGVLELPSLDFADGTELEPPEPPR